MNLAERRRVEKIVDQTETDLRTLADYSSAHLGEEGEVKRAINRIESNLDKLRTVLHLDSEL